MRPSSAVSGASEHSNRITTSGPLTRSTIQLRANRFYNPVARSASPAIAPSDVARCAEAECCATEVRWSGYGVRLLKDLKGRIVYRDDDIKDEFFEHALGK